MLKALITFVCGLGVLSLLYGVKKKKKRKDEKERPQNRERAFLMTLSGVIVGVAQQPSQVYVRKTLSPPGDLSLGIPNCNWAKKDGGTNGS